MKTIRHSFLYVLALASGLAIGTCSVSSCANSATKTTTTLTDPITGAVTVTESNLEAKSLDAATIGLLQAVANIYAPRAIVIREQKRAGDFAGTLEGRRRPQRLALTYAPADRITRREIDQRRR